MIFTNKYNLPKTVYDVLAADGYKAGKDNYSATSLLKSPRQLQLYKRNYDKIQEDVSDRVWSLLGQAAHNVLEKHGDDSSLTEERLYVNIGDKVLSGQVDHYHDGVITDYKVTSVWTIMKQSKIEDWTKQLNTYAFIFKRNRYTVNRLQIIAILRDWSETEKLRYSNYPESPIVAVPITLWEDVVQEAYITDRIELHNSAEKLPSVGLPPCTPEEMWQTPNVYAVMKEGRKSALKLFESEEDAKQFSANVSDEAGNHIYIQTRLGTCRNCERYCPVSNFCSQWSVIKDAQTTLA
jgi:hypothetical protein